MGQLFKVGIYFFILLIAAGFSEAIGIGMFTTEINFEPKLNENFQAFINNNVGTPITVELTVDGTLAEYLTFSEDTLQIPAGGRAFFSYNLKLPESIPPGKNRISIGATDITPTSKGGISTKTAVHKSFYIIAPYDGKYVSTSLRIPQVFVGTQAPFTLSLEHQGDEVIDTITGSVTVKEKSSEGNTLATLQLEKFTKIQPKERRDTQVIWDFTDQSVGDYFASATLMVDGKRQQVSGSQFRIGELLVTIEEYNDTFTQSGITRMEIIVKNLWNEPIEGVYAELSVGDLFLRSSEAVIDPGVNGILALFLDTDALELGKHSGSLTVHYADKTAKEDITIRIVTPQSSPKPLSTQTLLIVVIALLVGTNFLLALFYFKKKEKASKSKK